MNIQVPLLLKMMILHFKAKHIWLKLNNQLTLASLLLEKLIQQWTLIT